MKNKLLIMAVLSLFCNGCADTNKVIKVGASSTPHALILEQAKEYLNSKGYKLEIVIFNDYVLPNLSLENGELDANYFQHLPYLLDFNNKNHTNLVSKGAIHFEPLGIYSNKKDTLEEIENGNIIIVPNDKSNYERAVDLLILNNININNIDLIQVEAQMIPTLLSDCDYAIINGNYALSSNVIDKVIVTELSTSEIAIQMANIIAVKKENENNQKINLLMEALKQENVKEFIKEQFGESVIPMF